jgi:hypothetical protein
MDKDPVNFPPDSLLTDSCDVNGNSTAPSTYWVGATGTAGHTITLTLPCTVTIDRQTQLDNIAEKLLLDQETCTCFEVATFPSSFQTMCLPGPGKSFFNWVVF